MIAAQEPHKSITDRPRKVTANLFENKTLINAAGEPHTVTSNEASAIYRGMKDDGYLDDRENLTDKYYEEKKNGTLKFATCVKDFESAVTQILDTVYDPNTAMTTNGRDQPHLTLRAEKLSMKEFKELWERINTKSYYVVHFGSGELVKKAVYALNEKLHVSAVYFNVETGSMGEIESVESLNEGETFQREESHEGANGGKSSALRRVKAHSHVPYDLIGMLVAKTGLTRSTIGSIMAGIKDSVFEQFQDNPEKFILKASQLIKESLADSVVEHITYNPIDKCYETGIFINADVKGIIADANGKNGNMVKVNKHLIYIAVRYGMDGDDGGDGDR